VVTPDGSKVYVANASCANLKMKGRRNFRRSFTRPRFRIGVSLDNLVGAGEDRRRTVRPSALAVLRFDDQLEGRRLLDRQIGRLWHP